MKHKGITLLNYNFKGGVGKSSLTLLEGYLLSKQDKKVLFIDYDPQSNLSGMLQATYNIEPNPEISFYRGLLNYNLYDSICHMGDNIDLIPGDWNLNDWPLKIANQSLQRRWFILREIIKPLRDIYDYIMIDVPPSMNDIVRNAIMAADGITVVLQTQQLAYTSALKTVSELQKMRSEYDTHFTFLGIVLYLYNNAKEAKKITKLSKNTFGDALYKEPVRFQERVHGFTSEGIKKKDFWDIRVLHNYQQITNELIERIEGMINNG